MAVWAAFLRGVNLGSTNKVSMPVLRAWTHHTAMKFGARLDQP